MPKATIDRSTWGPNETSRRTTSATVKGVPADIRRILSLSVPVSVVLAARDMTIESVLRLAVGSIIEFDVPFDAELSLQAANRPIGAGQAVKVGENFGMRVNRIGSVRERIDALAGH